MRTNGTDWLEYSRIRETWLRYQQISPSGRLRLLRRILRSPGAFSPTWSWIFSPDPEAAHRLRARSERESLARLSETTSGTATLIRASWAEAVRQDWLFAGPEQLLSDLWADRFLRFMSPPERQEVLGSRTGIWLPNEQVWSLSVPYEVPDRYGRPVPPPPIPPRCRERIRRLWILSGSWRLPVRKEVWLRALDLGWEAGLLIFYFSLPPDQAPEPWVSFGLRLRFLQEWPGLGQDATCLTPSGLVRIFPVLEPRAWGLERLSGPTFSQATFGHTEKAWTSA